MKRFQSTLVFMSILFVFSFTLVACADTATSNDDASNDMAMDMSSDDKKEGDGMADMNNMDTMATDEVPSDLNTATDRPTDNGLFQAAIISNMLPVDINEIHSWTLHLETADGAAIEDAEVQIDGGMPQHNHGFPTTPQVTENLGQGDYLVEGIRFNMTGWWEMKFDIAANGQSDTITFNLVVQTGHSEEAMDHSEHGKHDGHEKHEEHEGMTHDMNKAPNDGRVISILAPETGTEIEAGKMIMVKIDTENFDITAEGNHWHLYVDGELHTMVEDGSSEIMLHDLSAGEHMIMTTLADESHVEYEDGAMVTIMVK